MGTLNVGTMDDKLADMMERRSVGDNVDGGQEHRRQIQTSV